MLNLLARLTMQKIPVRGTVVETQGLRKPPAPAPAAEPAGGLEEARATVFASPKSLAFPVLVALVKGAWEASKLLPVGFVYTIWPPFWACIILGMLITISNLTQEKQLNAMGWILGVGVGALNSLVVFGAVMGISH
jgi:hypothetical protein